MARLEDLLEATHDAVYLCECRRDGRGNIADIVVRRANERGLADLGLVKEKLEGRGMRELFRSVEMLHIYQMCVEVVTTGNVFEATYASSAFPRPGRYDVRITKADDGVIICTRCADEPRNREVTEVKRKISDAPGEKPPSRKPKGRTVLVVDDEAAIRRALGATLLAAGYGVLEAGDGRDALDLLETERVDVVISDVRMPRMDGLELAETLRVRRPSLPVFLLSGWASPGDLTARGLDGTRLLEKPIDAQHLLDVVASAVNAEVSAAS